MDTTLNQLILMNVELEGLLRVAAGRPSPEALEAARSKFDAMSRLFDSLTPAEAARQKDETVTEVKYDEAENGEDAPDVEPSDTQIPFTGTIVEDDAEAEAYAPAPQTKKQMPEFRSLLTLNDKFLFRRELFNGSDSEMSDTLSLIGSMESADEAREYLLHDLQWNESNPVVSDFLQLVNAYFKS